MWNFNINDLSQALDTVYLAAVITLTLSLLYAQTIPLFPVSLNTAGGLNRRILRFFSIGRLTSTSISARTLVVFCSATTDRVESVKDFYDFKHKNISSVITGVSGVILVNVGAIVKYYWERHDVKELEGANIMVLLMATIVLLICNMGLLFLLRKCALNFIRTVRIMEDFK